MVAVVLSPTPVLQFLDNAGNPAVGGTLLTQVASVNYPTYSDSAGSTPLPNPIPLNSRGEVSTAAGASSQLFIVPNTVYQFTLFDKNGNQLGQAPYVYQMVLNQASIGALLWPPDATEIGYFGSLAAALAAIDSTYIYGDVRRYGVILDGTTDNTTAMTTVIALAGYAATNHAPEATIIGACGICLVSQITFNVGGITFIGNGMSFRGNAAIATTSVVEVKTGNNCIFRDLTIDCNFNTNYQCALHWYTNNVGLYYPGFCRFEGAVTVVAALIGLCIGGLPTQALPIPASNTVQSPGIAVDAPVSESYMEGLNTVACVQGLYMAQPNGKVAFIAPQLAGTGSHGGWSGHSYGSSGYTDASAAALLAILDATQSNEISIIGGSIEQSTEPTGKLLQCANSNLQFIGTTVETSAPASLSLNAQVTFAQCLDMGWNFSGSYSPFIVDYLANGSLNFNNCSLNYPHGNIAEGNGSPFISSQNSGSYAYNQKGFCANFVNVELRDIPFAPLGGASGYTAVSIGIPVNFTNCKLTSYDSSPAITACYPISDGQDLLANVVDQSAYTITAFGANGNASSGGWDFVVTTAGSWGSNPSGIAPIGQTIDTCLQMTSGGTTGDAVVAAQTNASPVTPQHCYLFRTWLQGGSTGKTITVTANWYNFAASAASTANTSLLAAADTVIGGLPIPCVFLAQPPKDATQVKMSLKVQDGAGMFVTLPSLK